MKTKNPQPAQKSYFFGQGYKDIASAIRQSWAENAQTARKYYNNYRKRGLMSFVGIFNLFCALSVVTFGTIFFAVISLVMTLFVSVLFLLVYLGWGIVWSFDRLYLIRKKIFTACHECKEKVLIPIYICPKCHARHTNLTPGVYGILKRKCQCGEKLPTTFFNGRKKLTAICPVCAQQGRITVLYDRESRPLCVPVVGGRSVGKTAYITAFSRDFINNVAPEHGLDVELYNESMEKTYGKMRTDYIRGSTDATERSSDITRPSAISFSFFVQHKSLHPERLVHIYDIAGEVFTDNDENEVQRQYEYCQGIIFMLDPFAIPSVRAEYGSRLASKDRAVVGMADINGIIDVFFNKLHQVTGLSDREMSNVPFAVVIGKTDSAELWRNFSSEKIEKLMAANAGLSLTKSDAMDFLCRKFLIRHGMAAVVNAIDMKFRHNCYFAVSAMGHSREEGSFRPVAVMEPMEWICTMADRQLAGLWVKNKYSRKRNKEIVDVGE